jgi:16S rRNA (cytosine1402-N4)-methyltransferase
MSDETPVHKRRPRYRGSHPRRFEEKYKEHDPARYADEVQHVIAKGKTPAGMHLPICVEEILAVLKPAAGQMALDATLGYGGHAQRLMPHLLPGGRLFAIDVDPVELPRSEARMRALGYTEECFVARQMNFSALRSLLGESGGFDCIVADLGVSSMQLDNPARGFSYKLEGPLDLRLNPGRGQAAWEMLAAMSLERLEKVLREYADEPYSQEIARAIKGQRQPPDTTQALSALVKTALKRRAPEGAIRKSLQRTFMALRIAVNEEFGALDRFLANLPACLRPGGRVAILSFHSGEDRRVKRAFACGREEGWYDEIAPTPVLPGAEERRLNPRSGCAKLRWAVRSEKPLLG